MKLLSHFPSGKMLLIFKTFGKNYNTSVITIYIIWVSTEMVFKLL